MAVDVKKLWNNAEFNNLCVNSKLLYIYLITNPSINNVGVINLNVDVALIQLNMSLEDFRYSTNDLLSIKYINICSDKLSHGVYFIVPKHFSTVGKSQSVLKKIDEELESLPDNVVKILNDLGINKKSKTGLFVKPTAEEVFEYALSKGYVINGEDFVTYYDNQASLHRRKDVWVDGRGKEFSNWKMKLLNVWCKPDRKIQLPKNPPKGMESLHIKRNDEVHVPQEWRNGLPCHNDFLIQKELTKEYEKRSRNS